MLILKVTKNKAQHSLQTAYFLKHILRVKAWIFLSGTSIYISFCQISSLSLYLNKNKLWENCYEDQVKSMMPDIWYLPKYVLYTKTLTHVHDHVRRFYGNC